MTTPIRFPLPFRLAHLWLCICAFSSTALFSQQNLVISGSHTLGTIPCQAVDTITTDLANPFTVGGSASVKCQAGGTIRLRSGFRATAGTGSPTFEAFIVSMAVAPALTSPAAGASGPALTPQTFVLTFSDNLGYGDISSFQVSFGGTGATAGICSLSYSGGVLGLWDDTATQLLQAAPLQNSQCAVGAPQVTGAGTTLTFAVPITFFTSFQGSQEIYALAVSASGDFHPWVDLGSWTVIAPTTQTRIFSTAGTHNWTAPAGVTSVQVEAWGPGGDGANTASFPPYYTGGGGGGGGAYAKKTSVPVTPGQDYTVVVGASGSATRTAFAGTAVIADAGINGAQATSSAAPGYGGPGGQASNSTGDVLQSGANGGNAGSPYGGYGGNSGNGGPGGLGGGLAPNGNGTPGTAPGGGGGGAASGANYTGAAGGGGQVVLTYAGPSVTTYSISGQVTASGVGLRGVTIALTGGQTDIAMTDANGNYSIPYLSPNGNYTLTASKTGYILSSQQTYTNLTANQIATFTATAGSTQYQLITNVGTGAGTVNPACPGGCAYTGGSQVTIMAMPAAGYQFVGFSGSVSSGSNPLIVNIGSSMTVTANFTPISTSYQLTTNVSPAGGGTITPACPGGCSYGSGTQVMVTAMSNPGYQFTGFSGSLTGGSPGYLTMNSNKSVTANFTPVGASTQTVTSVPNGLALVVDGIACTSPCSFQWAPGTTHTIAAGTQAGVSGTQYLFASWSDGGAFSHTVTAQSSSTTYTATFTTQYPDHHRDSGRRGSGHPKSARTLVQQRHRCADFRGRKQRIRVFGFWRCIERRQ
jgi:hypothetical protein